MGCERRGAHGPFAGWDEHLVHPHLPRTLTRLLRDAGLEVTDRQIVRLFNAGYHPNTYSAGMLELIAAFVPGRNGVSEAEATAWTQDLTELGPDYLLSLNRYLFLAHKPPDDGAGGRHRGAGEIGQVSPQTSE